MSTIRFSLTRDKIDKKGKAPVDLIYQVEGERKFFRTGKKMLPLNWNQADQKAIYMDKATAKKAWIKDALKKADAVFDYDLFLASKEAGEINSSLGALENEVRDAEKRFELNGTVYSASDLVQALKDARAPVTKKEATSKHLFFFIDKYITDHRATRKQGSLSVYNALKNHLEKFQASRKKEITFENIDYSFFQEFQNFLIDKQGLSNTTVAKVLSTVKTFINYARIQGVTVSDRYKDFKIKRESKDVIALTNEEFEALYKMDLSGNKKFAKVRDVFCFSCVTGLRYSDLKQLAWVHINRDEIKLTVTKTTEPLTIPLNPFSQAILAKYKSLLRPLPDISNQKMNMYLKGWESKDKKGKLVKYKGLCELAGINEEVEVVSYRGPKREAKTYPKYKLIGVHTGRKTFATLSLERGMSAEETMTITGHKDYKSFKRYVKVTEQRKKVVMGKAWGLPKKNNLKAI